MTSEEWAAWVQAGSSVAGLIAAFLIPWRVLRADHRAQEETRKDERKQEEQRRAEDRQREEEERRSSMRIAAFTLVAEINDSLPKIDGQITRLLYLAANHRPPNLIQKFGSTDFIFPDIREFGTGQYMFLFGDDIGRAAINLALRISRYNRMINFLPSTLDGEKAPEIGAELDPIRNELIRCRDAVAERAGIDSRG